MYYFIVNKTGGSGKARKTWEKVKTVLEKRNIKYQVFVPECNGYAAVLAEQISEKEDDDIRLIVVGGDGTVNEVLNGLRSFERVKFAVIPTGSGNDFCRGINVSLKSPEKVINQILDCKQTRKIDIGVVESGGRRRFFGISSGFGLNAIVGTTINTSKLKVFMNKVHLNSLSYAVMTVITLFSMKTNTYKISFDGGPLQEFPKSIFLAAMNFRFEGGGVPMAPDAKCDDGKLSFCLAFGIPKWRTFFAFPFLLAAKHGKLKGFLLTHAKTADVFSSGKTVSHTDGELFGKLTRVHYESVPQKLAILI